MSNELYALGYFSAAALLVALLLIGVQLLFLALEQRYPGAMLKLVPGLICLGIAASTLLSGRNLKFASLDIGSINAAEGGGGASGRLITALVLAICFAKIASHLLRIKRAGDQRIVGGGEIFATLALYFICSNVLPAVFGTQPTFVLNSFYAIFVFWAFFMARASVTLSAILAARNALTALIMGSLLAAVVLPRLAIQPNYDGWIPGFTIRLWGLGSHANSIGPLALVTALLLYFAPYQSRALSLLAWISTFVAFVLAQSKTAWAIGLGCGLLLAFWGRGRTADGRLRPGYVVFLLALTLIGAAFVLAFDWNSFVRLFATDKAGAELSTLTGRTAIWSEAVRTWMANVWFGYGPDAWGPAHRARIGMPFAFHAHNQLMQSLSATGLLGAFSMLAHMGTMLIASWRAASPTRGVSMAIAMLMFVRALSEAPFGLGNLYVGETLTQVVWFLLVLLPFQTANDRQSVRSSLKEGV